MSTNVLVHETQNISSGASPSTLEYDFGRRTEVVVVRSLLLSCLNTIANRYCCETVERSHVVDTAVLSSRSANHLVGRAVDVLKLGNHVVCRDISLS